MGGSWARGCTVINLQDGFPISRTAEADYNVISYDQSEFTVEPAGAPGRLDFQTLIDFSIGKRWQLPGRVVLKTDLQFFNILNSTAVIDGFFEDEYPDELGQWVSTEWVRPRRLMLRIGLEY